MSNRDARRPTRRALWVGALLLALLLLVAGMLLAYNGMVGSNPVLAIGGFITIGLGGGFLTTPLTARLKISRPSRKP